MTRPSRPAFLLVGSKRLDSSQVEEQRAAEFQIDSMMRDAAAARSRAALAAVESGAAGGSSAEVLQEMTRQGLEAETGVRRQFAASSQELAFNAQDINKNLKNTLEQYRSQAVTNMDVGMQLGQAAIGSYLGAKASGIVPADASFAQTFFGTGGASQAAAASAGAASTLPSSFTFNLPPYESYKGR